MKRTDSTEMDRLLRRHFRRNGETLSDGGGASAQESEGTSHLDADEMNAYAEGALPEAARSRYFAHLADCDDCRKLVTELALAFGAISEERRAAAQEPSPSKSWREWLAALLSPPVLRYGVPALALLAVIIVAIIALRARREEPSVAQNHEAARNSALSTSPGSNSPAESSTATTAENHATANASSSNIGPATAQQPQPEINAAATPTPPPTKATMEENAPAASPSVAAKTEAQSGGILDKKQEDRPGEDARSNNTLAGTAAAPPPPAPATKPAPAYADDMAKRDEERKQKSMSKDADETVVVTGNAGVAATTQTTSAEASRERGRVAARSAQSLPMNKAPMNNSTRSAPAGGAVEKESSSETRTVGGHNFRRQGGAWVDTSYNSSRTTINIARGSEQYRALLADEPGLRTITQKLTGEVIVAWGSKAYRFY